VGSELIRTCPDHIILGAGYHTNTFVPRVSTVQYYSFDVTNKEKVSEVIVNFRPDIVIHTAANASPDYCEQHPVESRKVNVEGTENVVRACQESGSSLIFFSSNTIFNGEHAPYNESSELDPIGEYGKHKVENELFVSTSGIPYTLIRSMSLYGWHNPYERKNFLGILIEKCMRGEPMQITNDVTCNFLHVRDFAKFVWDCVRGKRQKIGGEVFHVAGFEAMTHWDFTKKAIRELGLNDTNLLPVTMADLHMMQRGKDTRFDCSKAREIGFYPMSVSDGIQSMRKTNAPTWKFL